MSKIKYLHGKARKIRAPRLKRGLCMPNQATKTDIFERGSIISAILTLAIPTVVSQIILVVYNMADTYFIGMTGRDDMITAVTVCMPSFMFLAAIANLFGVGGSSVIARALGSGDIDRAENTASFSFWGCALVTAVYALGAYIFRDAFVNALGGSHPRVHGMAGSYLLITVVIGGLGTSLNSLLGHLVRSEGRSMHAGVGIALGGVLNIALDPLFMFALLPRGHEVEGAAVATALSNLIAYLYFLILIRRGRSHSVLRLRPTRQCLELDIPRDVLVTGLPACLMTLCENISYAVLDKLMSGWGLTCQTGIGIAKKVNMLAHSMVRGMAQGVLPLIAYNYAKGNHRRMRSAVLTSTVISVLLAALCMATSLLFSEPLVGIFIQHSSHSLTFGAVFLRILCIGGPFSACAYAFISFFQAVGESRKSFILAVLRKGILDIPLMFALNRLFPIYGIVWATPAADIACAAVAVVLFSAFIRPLLGSVDAKAEG